MTPSSTDVCLWHGAQRWNGQPEVRPPRAGCYEHGPGIYLTTRYLTAQKYAKGGGQTVKMTLAPGIRWLENATSPWDVVKEFVKSTPRLRNRARLMDELESSRARRPGQEYPLSYLVNLCVNNESCSGQSGKSLAEFLVSQGVDASLVSQSVEDWVVVFNPAIIAKASAVPASQVSLDDYDLPRLSAPPRSRLGGRPG